MPGNTLGRPGAKRKGRNNRCGLRCARALRRVAFRPVDVPADVVCFAVESRLVVLCQMSAVHRHVAPFVVYETTLFAVPSVQSDMEKDARCGCHWRCGSAAAARVD